MLAAALCVLGAAGCATYQGTARDAEPSRIAQDAGWIRVDDVPVVRQRGAKDCGAAALAAVLGYWGREATPRAIERATAHAAQHGIRAEALRRYATQQGLQAFVFFGEFRDIQHELARGRPIIVGTHKPINAKQALAHYEVVVGYHPARRRVLTVDPAHGLRENSLDGFMTEWEATKRLTLVVFEEKTTPAAGAAADRHTALQ